MYFFKIAEKKAVCLLMVIKESPDFSAKSRKGTFFMNNALNLLGKNF